MRNRYRADGSEYTFCARCIRLYAQWDIGVTSHFSLGNGSTIEFGRFLHIITTARAFILISVYLGLHWPEFMGTAKKIPMNSKARTALCVVFWLKRRVFCLYYLHFLC